MAKKHVTCPAYCDSWNTVTAEYWNIKPLKINLGGSTHASLSAAVAALTSQTTKVNIREIETRLAIFASMGNGAQFTDAYSSLADSVPNIQAWLLAVVTGDSGIDGSNAPSQSLETALGNQIASARFSYQTIGRSSSPSVQILNRKDSTHSDFVSQVELRSTYTPSPALEKYFSSAEEGEEEVDYSYLAVAFLCLTPSATLGVSCRGSVTLEFSEQVQNGKLAGWV